MTMLAPRLPPLYALRAFEVAARLGSFTQAAHSLCITQSAVSRHVKTLEEHFACRLFERSGSRLVLPFEQAVRTGDSYYLVWPAGGDEPAALGRLREYLLQHLPQMADQQIILLD